jgi:hypothetical protein
VSGGERIAVDALTIEELEAEVTIAAAEPRRRERRLDDLLVELARRRLRPVGTSAGG